MAVLQVFLFYLSSFAATFPWSSSRAPSQAIIPSTSSNSSSSDLPNFTYDELYKLQTNFLDNFIYPANVDQAKSINSTLLAENAQGRVDITRTFDGRELNTEYLFGLFANLAANPNLLTILGVPVSYEVIHFSANQHLASAQTRFMFNFTSLGLVLPVIIESWNTWNSKGEITQYDASFKYWQWMVDTVIGASMPILNATTPVEAIQILTTKVAASICNTAQTYCHGENAQYDSMQSCYQYLTQDTRFGSAYEVGRDTLLCRMVHQNMVPYRPSVHCDHIGPTGGGYCTDDTTYLSTVTNEYFKIPFIPYTDE